MKNKEFVSKLKNIAENYKTLYVMGCNGAALTNINKEIYIKSDSFNQDPERIKKIKNATSDTYGFDCVSIIKAILWGWEGDNDHIYGGATYLKDGILDVNADTMISQTSPTKDFSNILEGEVVWIKGHIGVYIGDGLVVECSPKFQDKVQITALENIGKKKGYESRKWSMHGKLPYIEY